MSVTFEELSSAPSPEVTATHTSFEATRRFKVAWSDTINFYKELMGYYTYSSGSVSYTSPAYFPGIPECLCRRVTFAPFPPDKIATATNGVLTGATATTNQPQYAFVTASYSTQSPQASFTGRPTVPTGSFASVHYDIGASMQGIKSEKLFYEEAFGAGPVKIPTPGNYGVLIPTHNFTVQWSRVPVPAIPWSKIVDATGRVNSKTFTNYPADFVLFNGADVTYEYQFTGDVLASLGYKFTAKKVTDLNTGEAKSGWTHLFIEAAGDYKEVVTESGKKLYTQYNFDNLFTYA